MHEEAHLVARRQRQACSEVALADCASTRDEILYGACEPLREEDRAVDAGQHREQQHHRQRQPEAVFQRFTKARDIVVLRPCLLNGFREFRELLRHLIDRDQIAVARRRRGERAPQRHRRAYQIATVVLRLQRYVGAAFCHLPDEIFRRAGRRQRLHRVLEARRVDALVPAIHRHFDRASRASLPVDGPREILWRNVGELGGEFHGAFGIFALADLERSARETERVVQPLLHLDVKPAVDAAIEELEREQIHDDQRHDHEHSEDRDGARREARAGDVIPIIANELQKLARDQRTQRDHAHQIQEQDERLQATELA